jgi:hypothetical protein
VSGFSRTQNEKGQHLRRQVLALLDALASVYLTVSSPAHLLSHPKSLGNAMQR